MRPGETLIRGHVEYGQPDAGARFLAEERACETLDRAAVAAKPGRTYATAGELAAARVQERERLARIAMDTVATALEPAASVAAAIRAGISAQRQSAVTLPPSVERDALLRALDVAFSCAVVLSVAPSVRGEV